MVDAISDFGVRLRNRKVSMATIVGTRLLSAMPTCGESEP